MTIDLNVLIEMVQNAETRGDLAELKRYVSCTDNEQSRFDFLRNRANEIWNRNYALHGGKTELWGIGDYKQWRADLDEMDRLEAKYNP